jgi:hypothetical protein
MQYATSFNTLHLILAQMGGNPSMLLVQVAILMTSPKVGKNHTYVSKHSRREKSRPTPPPD